MDSASLYSAAVLADHLIRLFTLCGSLPDAKHTFARVLNPTVFTWNAIISAHIQLFEPYSGLLFYCDMQHHGIEPNRVTFLCVLKACSSLHSLCCSRQAHENIIVTGLEADVIVANTLIDTYAKCGSVREARSVFDRLQYQRDVISWGSMISGYAQHGLGHIALDLYVEMQEKGIQPEKTVYTSILKACSSIGAVRQGRQIHDQISIQGLLSDNVLGGALIDMYIKCGKVKDARLVFDSLLTCDEISWSTMIAGYVQHGYGFPALELFSDMQQKKVKADKATYLCVLKACGLVGATEEGRLAHAQLIKQCLDSDMAVQNALIDMYACCASLEDACKVFNTLSNPDIASWGAIVSGYAECGQGMSVEQSLRRMRSQGFQPDSIIFMSILSACSHAGLLDEGRRYFKCMSESYNVAPSTDHYNCMVDLFCRAGCLDEAQMLLLSMPTLPDIVGWTSFFTSHKIYNDTQPA
eukprot:c15343_g1_i1 orf=438-1841(-)